jgi:hypothetical protein
MSHSRRLFAAGVAAFLFVGLSGCATDRATTPQNAQLLMQGHGRLVHDMETDGFLHVVDASREEIIFSRAVEAGDRVVVDGQQDRILINDLRVMEGRLGRGRPYRVYFEPATVFEDDTRPAIGEPLP